jgi:hypothetical protein
MPATTQNIQESTKMFKFTKDDMNQRKKIEL